MMNGAFVYSSSDEASTGDEFNNSSDSERELLELAEQEEDQQEAPEPQVENQAAHIGRPKKRKTPVVPPVSFQLLTSQRKNKNGSRSVLAQFEGEVYKRSGVPNTQGIQQWRCVKWNDGCKMVMESNVSNQCVGKSEGQHSHSTAKVDLDVRDAKDKIRNMAERDQSAARQIYTSVVEGASRKLTARLNPINVANTVYRIRKLRDGDPKISEKPEDMVIPDEYKHYKNSLFVMYDSGPSPRRIIVFSTPALMKFLEDAEWWGLDGTFALVPKGWVQLLTLHAKQGETFVPCIHALLPKKSGRTYDHFFRALGQLIPNARVAHVHMDYERTLITSFEHSYNLAVKHGCFAHFARALYRKVQKLGLTKKYKEGGEFSVLFDMLKSLVYVPTDDVQTAFDEITTQCMRRADGSEFFEDDSSEKKFVTYFVKTWLGSFGRRPLYSHALWNCYELTLAGKSKTTNSLEAWHNALKYALASQDGKRPRFWKWLRQMKKECSMMEAQIILLQGTPKKLRTEDQRVARQRTTVARSYNRERIFEYVRNQADFTLLDQF